MSWWKPLIEEFWQDRTREMGPPNHLQAMGALALSYNDLEHGLSHFLHHYMPDHKPAQEYLFGNLTNHHRTNLIRKFVESETDVALREAIDFGLRCFDVCAENRNLLLHAIPSGDVSDAEVLRVLKTPRGNPHVMNTYGFSTDQIRNAVWHTLHTADYLTRLYLFISKYEIDGAAVVPTLPDRPPQPSKLS